MLSLLSLSLSPIWKKSSKLGRIPAVLFDLFIGLLSQNVLMFIYLFANLLELQSDFLVEHARDL